MQEVDARFSEKSNVTLVLTSCGRFDLLQKTLESFFTYNSYPIKKAIIIEDSGNDAVYSSIPDYCETLFSVIVNNPKLGQIKAIDKAYAQVNTEYIFHCEDDWEFYRAGFIEDSIAILKDKPDIYQVWLRSFYHDVKINTVDHHQGKRQLINDVPVYKVVSNDPSWHGFSLNPGLRRLSDYQKIPGGYYGLFRQGSSAAATESNISQYVADSGVYVVMLENDAVAHIGFGQHVLSEAQKIKKKRRKAKERSIALILSLAVIAVFYKLFF